MAVSYCRKRDLRGFVQAESRKPHPQQQEPDGDGVMIGRLLGLVGICVLVALTGFL